MKYLNLPESKLAHHILTCGDTGTGKSTFIRQLLYRIRQRGDSAIILDSKREFTPEFFQPQLGDKILDPTDDRVVYFDLTREVVDEVDSVSIGRAAYPHNPANPQSEFFDTTARDVMASLIDRFRPRFEDLANWLVYPERELFPRLKGTEHYNTLAKAAVGQRSAILGTMGQLGRTLRMMPKQAEGRQSFSIRGWCEHRKGWIFLPNSQDTREALRPILTMFVDLLLLRLMSMGKRSDLPRVWFILDELRSLNTVAQLHSGITEIRDAGHPIVIGVQNLADLEAVYGPKADTIVSQSYFKLILATSHPRSRQMLADMIGKQWRERWEESISHRRMDTGHNYTRREYERECVTASEIGKLKDLEGYWLQRGEVTKIKMLYLHPVLRTSRHVPRVIPTSTPSAVPMPEPRLPVLAS